MQSSEQFRLLTEYPCYFFIAETLATSRSLLIQASCLVSVKYLLDANYSQWKPKWGSVSLSLRLMWNLKRLLGEVVSHREFLRPVSIATHSSSWALLPAYPFCHATSHSSSFCQITSSKPCWNGHWVDPFWLLLSLQSLWKVKPTWVSLLSADLQYLFDYQLLCW